jgi:hypothetical protein
MPSLEGLEPEVRGKLTMKNKISNTAEYIATDIRLMALFKLRIDLEMKEDSFLQTKSETINESDTTDTEILKIKLT